MLSRESSQGPSPGLQRSFLSPDPWLSAMSFCLFSETPTPLMAFLPPLRSPRSPLKLLSEAPASSLQLLSEVSTPSLEPPSSS